MITGALAPCPTIEPDNGTLKKVKPCRCYNGLSATNPVFREEEFYLCTLLDAMRCFAARGYLQVPMRAEVFARARP